VGALFSFFAALIVAGIVWLQSAFKNAEKTLYERQTKHMLEEEDLFEKRFFDRNLEVSISDDDDNHPPQKQLKKDLKDQLNLSDEMADLTARLFYVEDYKRYKMAKYGKLSEIDRFSYKTVEINGNENEKYTICRIYALQLIDKTLRRFGGPEMMLVRSRIGDKSRPVRVSSIIHPEKLDSGVYYIRYNGGANAIGKDYSSENHDRYADVV